LPGRTGQEDARRGGNSRAQGSTSYTLPGPKAEMSDQIIETKAPLMFFAVFSSTAVGVTTPNGRSRTGVYPTDGCVRAVDEFTTRDLG
jgi:hypothetical protein